MSPIVLAFYPMHAVLLASYDCQYHKTCSMVVGQTSAKVKKPAATFTIPFEILLHLNFCKFDEDCRSFCGGRAYASMVCEQTKIFSFKTAATHLLAILWRQQDLS